MRSFEGAACLTCKYAVLAAFLMQLLCLRLEAFFLLIIELLCLQLCLGAFLVTIGDVLAYNGNFLYLQWENYV